MQPGRCQCFADFQAVHKGPPGWELSQGLPLGLNNANEAMFRRIANNYYKSFLAAAPQGTAKLYTEEDCWEDFVLGTVVWQFAYTKINLQTLPGFFALPDDDPVLNAWRVIFPRAGANADLIGVVKPKR
eukprot:SAG31_NODE_6467_length_2006_cov_1.609334_1_plen_129_part_00